MGKKFTFKKEKKETGLRAVGNPYQSVYIKLNGCVVGMIDAPNWQSKDHKWAIRLAIKETPQPGYPANFAWITLKTKFDIEAGAREFLSIFGDELQAKFDLHLFEPESFGV